MLSIVKRERERTITLTLTLTLKSYKFIEKVMFSRTTEPSMALAAVSETDRFSLQVRATVKVRVKQVRVAVKVRVRVKFIT